MVTDTEGYAHIIEYLIENLSLFEHSTTLSSSETIIETIEQELSEQIILICGQNNTLTFNQRNMIIREVDAIVYDLEEVLSVMVNNPVSNNQRKFIIEFSTLIKNLFDTEIHNLAH